MSPSEWNATCCHVDIEFADKNFACVARKLDLQILTTLSVGGRVGTLCVGSQVRPSVRLVLQKSYFRHKNRIFAEDSSLIQSSDLLMSRFCREQRR